MNIKEIETLMATMERTSMKRVVIKREDFELELEKQSEILSSAKSEEGRLLTSPMVGTFYEAPSPKDAPYVKVGDTVEKGQVICIVESMKVMNEIKAQEGGRVVEILVKNGEPVEFGTKLMRVV